MAKNTFYKDKIEPNLKKIEEMKAKGVPISKIAELLDISKTALYKHINRNPILEDSVKKGVDKYASSVESAAFKLACGYDIKYSEKEYEIVNGKKVLKSVKTKVKHVLPNPVIQIFLLKNLMPEKYKDRVEGDGNNEKPIIWEEKKIYEKKDVILQDGQNALSQEKSES